MKKLALILALILIPCAAFGLEMLNDNALEEVTGQSGVSIAFDDVQLFLHVDRFAYLDCDGYGTNSNYGGTCASNIGGGFVIENFEMDILNINMIGLAGNAAAFYEGTSVGSGVIDGAFSELNVANFFATAVPAWFNGVYGGHIDNGQAYGLVFDDGGTDYYRNPGVQTTVDGDGDYVRGYFTGSIYTGYTGSLPLASASCGSIPLFYDYGQTTSGGSCTLISGPSYNFGLNNYVNTNNISTIATFHPQAVTIDVTGALPLHTTGMAKAADPGSHALIGGVLIGLPTAEFHIQQMHIGDLIFTSDLSTTANQNLGVATASGTYYVKNNNASFGTILIEGVTFTTFGGWMELAPTFTEAQTPNGLQGAMTLP